MEITRPRGPAKAVRLEQMPVPRLLFALLHKRFVGTIQLEQAEPAGPRTVWFQGGMPVYTDWISARAALGEVLRSEQMITEDQLNGALSTMAKEGGLLGPILVRLGHLDDAALQQGLMRQCRRKLLELFAIREGEVVLTAGPYEAPAFEKTNALELIAAGVAAHYDETRVATEMAESFAAPLAGTEGLARYVAHFKFAAGDKPMLDALAGATSYDALCRLPGASRRRAAQLVYTLWTCQMLRAGAGAVAVVASPSPSTAGRATPKTPASLRAPTPTSTAPSSSNDRTASGTPTGRAPRATPTSVPRPTTQSTPAATSTGEIPAAVEVQQTPEQFTAELGELEAKVASKAHAFDLLGIAIDSGKREIRRAFGELSRRFHPDSLQARGLGDLRPRVSDVFAALSEAQALLSDETKREQLRDAVSRGITVAQSTADATAMARSAFESELLAKDGDKYLKAGRFDRAHEHYSRALQHTPDEPDLIGALTFCTYNLSHRTREDGMRAQKELAAVLADAPLLARVHYFHGLVLRDLGAVDPALAALNRAMELDPRLIDAERQARALRSSRPAAPAAQEKPRGGLRGMFGKK